MKRLINRGFTLVELVVIAPVVIVLIGVFIALAVNITGEVLSSRGANMLTYHVQDALNRIEQDVKLSTTYLAETNINLSTPKQGFGGTTSTGSTTPFTNVDKSSAGGSYASLILNTPVTNDNPLLPTATIVYLKDQPNPCSTFEEYSKNRPMTMNVVYFVDDNDTLWRRVIMPANYLTSSARCGSAPWQIPTCIDGYVASALTFCKANDERLIEGVSPEDFVFNFYTTPSSATANTTAVDPLATSEVRNVALQSTPTIEVSITARQTIAGRDVKHTASLRATRLDINASSIATNPAPTSSPAAPNPVLKVVDGHIVNVTWPRVPDATSYQLYYQVKADGADCDAATSGTWKVVGGSLSNDQRSQNLSFGTHTDRLCVRMKSANSYGLSTSYTVASVVIPLWAPLLLQNGWTAYGSTYSVPAYTKTKSGLVMLKGMIKKSTPYTSGEIIAQLPEDYRPADGKLMFATTVSGSVLGRVDVYQQTGNISLLSGNSSWLSLETVRFTAASESYTRTYVSSLSNGWVNYSEADNYAQASYIQDTTGRVVIQGLIKDGVMTDNTTIFTLPSLRLPPQYLHIASIAATNKISAIGIATGGQVQTKGLGNNGYLSINANFLANAGSFWTNLTLQNGWVAYPGYSTPQYVKAADGVVHLKGLIRSGTTGSGTIIANLNGGFRPKERIIYTTVGASTAAGHARIDIQPNGNIFLQSTPGNAWLSLDGISFYAEQ